MDKVDWKTKLTSRKFWAAVCNFVMQLLYAFKFSESEVSRIVALIMAGAGVIAYIIGEGLADAADAKSPTVIAAVPTDESKGEE